MRSSHGINVLTAAEAGFTPPVNVWVLWAWPEHCLASTKLFETHAEAVNYMCNSRPCQVCCICLVQNELDAVLDPDGREALL